MIKYFTLLFIGFAWGQADFDKLVLKNNMYRTLPIYAKNDSSRYSQILSDLFLINDQLNNHIIKHNKDIKIILRDFYSPDNRYYVAERYNKLMVYPLCNTPERIFSFYSSLEYGR